MTWRTGLSQDDAGVPLGGAAGQVLAKNSARDLDTQWVAPATGDVVGPSSAVDGRVAQFDGTSGKLLKDGGLTLSGTNTGDQTISLTGDVTGSGTGSFAATVANDAVSYAKMQNVSAASKLLGRGDSGSGDPQEITLGTGLSMSGTTINASGGGGGGATLMSAFLTATQANSTVTPAVLTGHTFTVAPGQVLQLTGQMIFTTDATTTGAGLGVRVAQAGGADAHAIGSAAIQVPIVASAAGTQVYDSDGFDVAAGANSLFDVVAVSSQVAAMGAAYQLCVKNLATTGDTTVTIEFRSEVAASAVTAQIGTGCAGVKG